VPGVPDRFGNQFCRFNIFAGVAHKNPAHGPSIEAVLRRTRRSCNRLGSSSRSLLAAASRESGQRRRRRCGKSYWRVSQ
jgi:hypothetical protein